MRGFRIVQAKPMRKLSVSVVTAMLARPRAQPRSPCRPHAPATRGYTDAVRFHLKPRNPGKAPASMSTARASSDSAELSEEKWIPAPLPAGVELLRDATPAKWLEEAVALRPLHSVGHLVPDVFEAYARVLHPALSGLYDEPVRWSAVAAKTGRVAHRLMQFVRVAGLPDDPNTRPHWGERPRQGVGPLMELTRALRPFTPEPHVCWIGLWEGFGGLDMIEELNDVAKVRIPQRAYYLLRGPLESVPALAVAGSPWKAPNLWWPHDRSWCVATDIDLDSTYVGGTRKCIDAVLCDPALEAFPSRIEDRFDIGADEVNPGIPRPPRRGAVR